MWDKAWTSELEERKARPTLGPPRNEKSPNNLRRNSENRGQSGPIGGLPEGKPGASPYLTRKILGFSKFRALGNLTCQPLVDNGDLPLSEGVGGLIDYLSAAMGT